MKPVLSQSLAIMYGCSGIIGFIAYWPTIRDLSKYKKQSANLISYFIWGITTGITFLYALFMITDILFKIISGINFGACLTILVLSKSLSKTAGSKSISSV